MLWYFFYHIVTDNLIGFIIQTGNQKAETVILKSAIKKLV